VAGAGLPLPFNVLRLGQRAEVVPRRKWRITAPGIEEKGPA
jgi:hypothetical protein